MTFLKRVERALTAPFKLARTERMAKTAFRGLGDIRRDLNDLHNQLDAFSSAAGGRVEDIGHRFADLESRLTQVTGETNHRMITEQAQVQGRLAALQFVLSDLSRRLDHILGQTAPPAQPSAASDITPSPGFEMFKHQFYRALEDRYRGAESEIARRLKVYLPEVEAAVMRAETKPILDLGCGRGEWLGLLDARGLDAWGVDMNPAQIESAQARGLDAREGDVMSTLAAQPDNSFAVITAHHLIEHLPFDTVAWIAREALRVLAPGGILLFETPNTRNVLVGATTFHTDPTHLKPMPEQVMGVLLETAGYHPVVTRGLNAHERYEEFRAMPDMNDELAFLLFGPQDLAILGTKPLPEAG